MNGLMLTGEQKKVLTLPVEHPVLIKGSAGSGKTTVAVYRALHLMQTQQDLFRPTRVAIFSYTNALVNYVRDILGMEACEVTTLHRFAGKLLWQNGFRTDVETDLQIIGNLVQAAVALVRSRMGDARAVLEKPADFYREEIRWIKGRRIANLEAYQATARVGRGTGDRVTAQDKELLWEVLEAYNAGLADRNRIDWEDAILRALSAAENPAFVRPITHIVVDEAQDLTFAQLSLIARLISAETDSITLVADSAQRIYQSGFSWADTGLNVRGRSFEFRHNYRNTRQIAAAACSLINKDDDRSDFTEAIPPDREGSKPVLILAGSPQRQIEWLARKLPELIATGSVAVASVQRRSVKHLAQALSAHGIPTRSLGKGAAGMMPDAVAIDTLHAVKGIEFDHVILCDLNEGILPTATGAEDAEDLSRARKLLYVGMTRARQTLTMITSGTPSRLLSEIDPQTLTQRGVADV